MIAIRINLLVVHRGSVNLIGYITVDYLTNRFHVAVRLFSDTPFAVHYEEIRIHLRGLTTNSAKMHS